MAPAMRTEAAPSRAEVGSAAFAAMAEHEVSPDTAFFHKFYQVLPNLCQIFIPANLIWHLPNTNTYIEAVAGHWDGQESSCWCNCS